MSEDFTDLFKEWKENFMETFHKKDFMREGN